MTKRLTESARLEEIDAKHISRLLGLDNVDEPECERCGGEISDGECIECGELAECR
jgi:hypothetical protein